MVLGAGASAATPATIVYLADLSGAAEAPPNASPGTGTARVDLDLTAHTMRVQITFSGLVGTTTASHIHACTATPGTGTAPVATQTPSFVGFPLGVTSGTYDNTFDTSLASTYSAGYLGGAGGGTAAGAEAALAACIAAGGAYVNVHSTFVPGGEIRGFLRPATPTNKNQCKQGGYRNFIDPRTADFFTNQGQCVSFVATTTNPSTSH